jgi:flagellar motor switch protein FliN/FliY
MAPDDEQDKLAEEWAAALAEGGDEGPAADPLADEWAKALAQTAGAEGGDGAASSDDALADEWAAALSEGDGGGDGGGGGSDAVAGDWAAALAAQEEDGIKKEKEQQYLRTQTRPADFKDLTKEAKNPRMEGTKRDLDFILDIPLDVSAELGRSRLLINELLQLGQGSVVELNKLAGEPLEIYVNGKLVARGEAVVINEKFGIRLTDIISPIERVKQLA